MVTTSANFYGATMLMVSKILVRKRHLFDARPVVDPGMIRVRRNFDLDFISRLVKAGVTQTVCATNTVAAQIFLSSEGTTGKTLHRPLAQSQWLERGRSRKKPDTAPVTSDLLESLPIPIVGFGEREAISFANPSAIELFGYRGKCMQGMPASVLFPEPRNQGDHSIPDLLVVSDDRQPRTMTLVARKADGTEFLAEVSTNLCRISGIDIRLAIIVDRSERYELQRNAQELAHLARVSSLGEMAGSLAHELNQPLTAILSNVQAVQHFIESTPINLREVRETLKDVVADDCRASEIIRRIRTLVRKGEIEVQRLDLASLIHDVVSLVHSDAIIRGIQTKVHVDDDLPPVCGDRVQLQQVVLNLLLNAFEAVCDPRSPGRTVEVDVTSDRGGSVQIAVRDRGPGVTVEQLDMIFKPYFTSKPHGLGLGLSISRTIVLKHGGSIWALNNPDCGATFYVNLPAEGTAG